MKIVIASWNFHSSLLRYYLKNRGHEILMVHSDPIPNLPYQKCISWDDLKKEGIPKGYNAVVNMAQCPLFYPLSDTSEEHLKKVWDSNIMSTVNIVQAIEKSRKKPPNVFVNMSSCDIYGHGPDAITEYSKIGDNIMSGLYHEREQASKLPEDIATRLVTIRQGHVFHYGEVKAFDTKDKNVAIFGPSSKLLPLIHINDLIKLYGYCIEGKHEGVFNAVTPQQVPIKTIRKRLEKGLWFPNLLAMLAYRKRPDLVHFMTNSYGQHVLPTRTLESGFEFDYEALDTSQNIHMQ